MKIFSASQIREWDKYSIEHEPITSIDLMERASRACFNKIKEITNEDSGFIIFAGPGNNGGDGFAIARMLVTAGRRVRIFHFDSPTLSSDCKDNRDRWIKLGHPVEVIFSEEKIPTSFDKSEIIIDAIFGIGQTRSLAGLFAKTCERINASAVQVISIDIPTGILSDESSVGKVRLRSDFTVSFQSPKLCFFLPENRDAFGQISILDIGLDKDYYKKTVADFESLEPSVVGKLLKPRDPFSHKGNFGQALMLAGSLGMMGASLLAARACLRSGVGKLFSAVPSGALNIFQSALPEAICLPDPSENLISSLPEDIERFDAIGVGPGLGKDLLTRNMIGQLLRTVQKPLVLDADALNIIAEDGLINDIPPGTVITPHLAEFGRLFGESRNDRERLQKALEKAKELSIYIVLKGRYTLIASPDGRGDFNLTGNAGMAKGGSGDVLTGMITGLIAQGYSILTACQLGVCLHGIAGDLARDRYSEQSMLASDIIEEIGGAFLKLS